MNKENVVYILGFGVKSLGKNRSPWPYHVDFDTSRPSTPFVLSEGYGYNAGGGHFSHRQLLEGSWDDHRRYTDSQWLWDFLKDIDENEVISTELILEAYQTKFGKLPRIK